MARRFALRAPLFCVALLGLCSGIAPLQAMGEETSVFLVELRHAVAMGDAANIDRILTPKELETELAKGDRWKSVRRFRFPVVEQLKVQLQLGETVPIVVGRTGGRGFPQQQNITMQSVGTVVRLVAVGDDRGVTAELEYECTRLADAVKGGDHNQDEPALPATRTLQSSINTTVRVSFDEPVMMELGSEDSESRHEFLMVWVSRHSSEAPREHADEKSRGESGSREGR